MADAKVVKGVEVEKRGEVGWIILKDYQATWEEVWDSPGAQLEHHALGVGKALNEFRYDPEVRVIVLTGENDGEFYRVVRGTGYDDARHRDRLNPLKRGNVGAYRSWPNALEIMALIEKPVIARLNGDAIGLGQAFLWGCDMIVARDDAVVADVHTGQQDVIDSNGEVRGFKWGVTPGDGAMSFAALYMPPTKLKEYMLLSRTWTTKQLAEMNIINYAVPAAELDDTLNEIIEKLLARPGYVIAHAKRVCNKHMINNWNLFQDLASAYEGLDFWTHAAAGDLES
jgi:enoyl-CoA hydratase/carnithine racemase